MPLTIGLLVFPGVQQLDLTGPYELFAAVQGAVVHLVAKDLAPVTSASKLVLTPTISYADCPPLDVLCVPGGAGVNALLEDEITLSFLRQQAAAARFVTSVCTGALVLGAAGLLQGKRATTHWNAHDFLAAFGAVPVHDRVVRDGALITAGGVTAGIDFALSVIAELEGRETAERIQLALEYAPAPPFSSGTPEEASATILDAVRQKQSGVRQQRAEIIARLTSRQ